MTCDDLEDNLMTLLDDGETNILLEMSKTEYISSAGLRVLILITKQLYDTGFFGICQPSEQVMEIIKMAGFMTIMNVYDDLEDAKNGIGK
jgi:anti-anti-sigma factor